MWRRHSIGILLFLLIVAGWASVYQPNPHLSSKSPDENFQPCHGEFNLLTKTDEDSGAKVVKSEDRRSNKKNIDYYDHLKPQHRAVLGEWITTKPYLRPAVEELDDPMLDENDSNLKSNRDFLRATVGEHGYQYYAVGDMNHDGKEDFAVLLVDSRQQQDYFDHFALAIFNAPFKKGDGPAYYEDGLYGISSCYIVFDKTSGKHLFLGIFEADSLCATYYPKGKTYYFKDCMD